MIQFRTAALALALILGGCASTVSVPTGSMAEGMKPDDIDVLADATVDLVRRQANPTSGVVGIQQAGDDTFTPALVSRLQQAGFNVVNGDRLRYQVGPMGDDILLRVAIDGADASQLYSRDKDGKLKAAGPLSIWRMGE